MTAKDKARELYDKFYFVLPPHQDAGKIEHKSAKQCALIAVDEIFEFMKIDDEYTETVSNANSKWVHYFIEVKKEIKKL
jgi:hypothetical protein